MGLLHEKTFKSKQLPELERITIKLGDLIATHSGRERSPQADIHQKKDMYVKGGGLGFICKSFMATYWQMTSWSWSYDKH